MTIPPATLGIILFGNNSGNSILGCGKKKPADPPVQAADNPPQNLPDNLLAQSVPPPIAPAPQKKTPVQTLITWNPPLLHNMDKDDPANWQMASWSNGNPFGNTWRPDHVSFNKGVMSLTLDKKACPGSCDGLTYASGEYRTQNESYGYGFYEVRMRPASGSGLMSGSFFTYRGVYGQPSHDEIDIEFLGKSCNSMQLNYYTEGKGGHERIIHFPFDACQEFHNYGFKWSEEALIFYVDGNEVHKALENPSTPQKELPYRPGKLMANLWAGTTEVDSWLAGPFVYKQPVSAEYDWIKYSSLTADKEAPKPVLTQPPVPAAPSPIITTQVLPIEKIKQGLFDFNGGKARESSSGYTFSANAARDPGFGIPTGDYDLEGRKTLKFEIKGSLTKLGGYARLIVQIYDDNDNDSSPAVSLDPVPLTQDFQTQSVDLRGKVDKAQKVQFLLVTDKGSCSVEIKNIRFE